MDPLRSQRAGSENKELNLKKCTWLQKGSAIRKQVIYSEIRKSPKRTTQKANREQQEPGEQAQKQEDGSMMQQRRARMQLRHATF